MLIEGLLTYYALCFLGVLSSELVSQERGHITKQSGYALATMLQSCHRDIFTKDLWASEHFYKATTAFTESN